ncbi:MAG: MFS family permease [Gammaproteobacteria bacterium]|jgi:MFS family permease
MSGSRKFTKSINLLTTWFGLMLGIMVVIPSTFSVFFDDIANEFDWNRAQVSLAFSLFLLASTIAFPIVGRLVDHFGARKIIIPSILTFMLGMISFKYWVDSLWLYYATFLVIGVAAAGTSTLTYFQVVTRSFSKRRGLALGVANSGTAVGALSFPVLGYLLLEAYGWRNAYLLLGIGITIISIPIILAGLNDKYIDSPLTNDSPDANQQATLAPDVTVKMALGSRSFWVIGIAFFCGASTLVAFLIHMVPMLTDRGISAQTAAIAASTFGVAQLCGRLMAGFLLDKYFAPYIAAAMWSITTITFLILGAGASGSTLVVTTAILGLAWGSEGDVLAYFVGRYFGLKFFGAIYGLLLSMHLLGGAVGPYLLGLGFDRFGSYTVTLMCMAATTAFAALLILFVGPYPSFSVEARAN